MTGVVQGPVPLVLALKLVFGSVDVVDANPSIVATWLDAAWLQFNCHCKQLLGLPLVEVVVVPGLLIALMMYLLTCGSYVCNPWLPQASRCVACGTVSTSMTVRHYLLTTMGKLPALPVLHSLSLEPLPDYVCLCWV